MSQQTTLEKRVEKLEKHVEKLTEEVFRNNAKTGWVQKILGSMKNDPDFAEILKLGHEIRQAERLN